jgi:hypothetical protein
VLPLEVSRAVATVLDEIARSARAGSAAGPSGPLP